MDILDGLKITFGRLEPEAVTLLQGDLEVLLLFGLRGERLAFGQLLVLEKRTRDQFRTVLWVRYCGGVLLV